MPTTSVRFLDDQIIDAHFPPLHEAGWCKLPKLVAVASEPLTAVIVPLVLELYCHAVVAKSPELFLQLVAQLTASLAAEEFDNSFAPA